METSNNTAAQSKLFIGVDEAGYGPNLGPLVIAASVWEVSGELQEAELGEAFTQLFRPQSWSLGCEHVPLGDSKELYQPATGLVHLETGLLATLGCVGVDLPSDLCEFANKFADTSLTGLNEGPPWYEELAKYEIPTRQQDSDEILRLTKLASGFLADHGIRLLDVQASIMTEGQFNDAVHQLDSKGQVLSRATLALVQEVLAKHSGPAHVYCDRQGGRKNYLPLLLDAFPDDWFYETKRSDQRCSYASSGTREMTVHFSVQGDQFPPTGLASMMAKYLRERMMEAFNQYWAIHLPSTKPTAGYPQDAKRFRVDMEPHCVRMKLPEHAWWRCR